MKNPFTKNLNTKVPAQLAVNKGTKKNTAGIKKVQTHQNVITEINIDISRKTFRRESGNKKQIMKKLNISMRSLGKNACIK